MSICKNRKYTTFVGDYDYCMDYEMGMCNGYDCDCPNYEPEVCEAEDEYTPSSTFGDYSPSCPWNAPGMSISDFI